MNKVFAYLALVLSVAFAAAPLLSGDFTGFRAEQLPIPQINPPVQPAGYAFAIWGIIYLWLIASAIYGVLYKRDDPQWTQVRMPLCISLAAGIPWLVIAQVSAIWATITIFIMLGGALLALHRTPSTNRWWLRGPIGSYAGWLTAASFVSLATTAAGYGVLTDGYHWAFAGIIGALIVTIMTYRYTAAPSYLATVVWALIGIIVANGMTNFLVTATAIGGIAVLICVLAIWAPLINRPR